MATEYLSHELHQLRRFFRYVIGFFRVTRGKGLAAVAMPLAFVLVALATQTASAQSGTPPSTVTDNDVNRVAHQLYFPVFRKIPLDVCPTQACFQWRETIRAKLAAGWTDQQILDYFVAQYGERVLAKPSTNGLNLLVWVIPPVLLLAGVVVLWRFLRTVSPPVAA